MYDKIVELKIKYMQDNDCVDENVRCVRCLPVNLTPITDTYVMC